MFCYIDINLLALAIIFLIVLLHHDHRQSKIPINCLSVFSLHLNYGLISSIVHTWNSY